MFVNKALNGWLLMVLRTQGEVTVICIAEFMFLSFNNEAVKKNGGYVRECVLQHAFYDTVDVLQYLEPYEGVKGLYGSPYYISGVC